MIFEMDRLAKGRERYSFKNAKVFREEEHPRADDGKFGKGSGGTNKKEKTTKKLTESEKGALEYYSGSGFNEINSSLKKGDTEGIKNTLLKMDSALEKLPEYNGLTTRIKMFDSPKEMESYINKLGKTEKFKEYLSSSKTKEGFSPVSGLNQYLAHAEFVIDSKKGKDISDYSVNKKEGEVLYPRGSSFSIDKIEKSGKGYKIYMSDSQEKTNSSPIRVYRAAR